MLKTPPDSVRGAKPEPSATLAALSDTMVADDLPVSFGTFKPVGHVMMGLPTLEQVTALVKALHEAGWDSTAVRRFMPAQSVPELRSLVDNAGSLAGFGYELALLRRYLALAQQGYLWLLVKVDDSEHAKLAGELAQSCGATLAVHYRMLTIEDLI